MEHGRGDCLTSPRIELCILVSNAAAVASTHRKFETLVDIPAETATPSTLLTGTGSGTAVLKVVLVKRWRYMSGQ